MPPLSQGMYGREYGNYAASKKRTFDSMQNVPLQELLEEADLKRKRLARKAELARLSRKRKKTRVSELEQEVQQLKVELERERTKVMELENERLKQLINSSQKGNQEAVNLDQCLQTKLKNICQLPTSTADNKTVYSVIQDFMDTHASKNACNDVHVVGFENSLGSCVVFSFLRWIMNQNDKFYTDPSGLWFSLFTQDLKCSPAQIQKLMGFREKMKGKFQEWNEVEAAFKRLCPLLRSYYGESANTLNSFVQLLEPLQVVNFFKWVEKFGEVCVKIKV